MIVVMLNVHVDNQIKYRIMKTLKKTKKIAKNPEFIVDLTNAETANDIVMEFVAGKVRAGLPISEKELSFAVSHGAQIAIEAFEDFYTAHSTVIENDKLAKDLLKMITKAIEPKKPWYKRFWSWLTKPFKKNK